LGTLGGHGVKELRFAGATWSTGTESGVSLAVFTVADGPTLDPAWLAEFYEAGAKGGKNVTSVEASDYAVGTGVTARRIDVLNGESYQTVVVWEQKGQVVVALVADFIREIQTKDAHEAVVRAAVDTLVG
jgi:putative component of toxin-antitoxin plasmid stabilization module